MSEAESDPPPPKSDQASGIADIRTRLARIRADASDRQRAAASAKQKLKNAEDAFDQAQSDVADAEQLRKEARTSRETNARPSSTARKPNSR